RLVIWSDALGVWRHAPALGTGLATFEAIFPGVRTIVAPVVFTHAESDWVQIATDTGTVGLIAVLATLGVMVASCLRARPRTRLDILGVAAAVAAVGVAIQGVGNF